MQHREYFDSDPIVAPNAHVINKIRAIQAAQLELERQQATDSLRKGLEKRPEREQLIERMLCAFKPVRLLAVC